MTTIYYCRRDTDGPIHYHVYFTHFRQGCAIILPSDVTFCFVYGKKQNVERSVTKIQNEGMNFPFDNFSKNEQFRLCVLEIQYYTHRFR